MFITRDLGKKDYLETYQMMRDFTFKRDTYTNDEIWLVEHFPVYTLGYSKKKEHVLHVKNISIIETDRGGQVTYHGPGQLVVYLLVDLKRQSYKVKKLVSLIEESVITYLQECGVEARKKHNTPGVFVENSKISALGLRVKKNCTYHGFSLNVNMDLSPFKDINPCGIQNMPVTQLINFNENITIEIVKKDLLSHLIKNLEETSKYNRKVA